MHALETRDRPAELLASPGIAKALFQRSLGDAERERAQADATAVQRVQELAEPVVQRAQHVLLRDDRVLEDELARIGGAPAELVLLLGREHPRALGERRVVADADPFGLLPVS